MFDPGEIIKRVNYNPLEEPQKFPVTSYNEPPSFTVLNEPHAAPTQIARTRI